MIGGSSNGFGTAGSRELRETEHMLRSVLGSVGEGIVLLDRELRYRAWNPFMEDLSGVRAPQVLGREVGEGFPEMRRLLPLLRRALAGEVVRSPDLAYREGGSGRPGWLTAVCSPHVGVEGETLGVVAIVSEVTDRRRAEDALRRSESRYRRLFEESRDAIVMTTPGGQYLDANAAALELLGYAARELTTANALEVWDDPAERLRLLDDASRAGSVREREVRLRRRDGSHLTCLLTTTAIRDGTGQVTTYQTIIHDITDRKEAEELRLHAGLHDALTGLPNRALFLDRAEHLVRRASRRPAEAFAVLFLDLDRFKYVNDSLGHVAGDELLATAARRIQSCLRQEDTVARFGGDEFGILLESVSDAADAVRVAERIQDELSLPFTMAEHELFASASMGIALWTPGYARAEDMLRDADTAMNRAKLAGRSRHEIFATEMHADVLARLRLETDLRYALERDELRLHYQPIVELDGGALVGFEALVRWQHPAQGLLAPAAFIGLAEETGLIVPLGWWVLREACTQLRRWLDGMDAARGLTMNVNLSARQFLQPDLVPGIERVLAETGVDPRALELEITESVFLENASAAAGALRELRQRGLRVCIDDFGTGYSSLSYLRRFPVDTLKIDRSFVTGLEAEGGNPKLVQAILALAQSLELSAIAEGVETPAQRQIVRDMGARLAQGHLFAVAAEAEEATRMLKRGAGW